MCWDLEKQKPIMKIQSPVRSDFLNTVNTVKFMGDTKVFLSGTRDGFIRFYDLRASDNPQFKVEKKHQLLLETISLSS